MPSLARDETLPVIAPVKIARRLLIAFCVFALAFPFASAQEPSPKKTARAKHAAKADEDSDSSASDDATPVRKAKRVSKADEESDADSTPSKSKRIRKAKRVRPAGVPDEEQVAPSAATMPVAGSAPRIPPNTRAQAVMVVDARTGEILYEKNADAPRAAASTQKLLTALIVAEQGYLDQTVTVQPVDTFAEPVKLNIRPGETYQRIDLLRALLVKSPNDVARCLARDNAGSAEAFAEKMNTKARQLGATHSFFLNPNGLPIPGQYSTARDLAIIARAAYANPTIRSIVCLPQLVFRYANGRTRELENTNRVLRRLPFCNGMKTGYTEAAGHCLIASGARPGRDVIAVVLGDSKGGVWQDASALLTWGLSI